MSNVLLYVYTTLRLSIHGHLGYFHFLAVVNTTAMNIGVETLIQVAAFKLFKNKPRSTTAR